MIVPLLSLPHRSAGARKVFFAVTLTIVGFVYLVHMTHGVMSKTAEAVNKERLAHLRSACERLQNGGKTSLKSFFYMHIADHRLMYCLVFKSATTSWFYYVNKWAGHSDEDIRTQDNFFLSRQKYLYENETTLLRSMNNAYTFIVVRNPLERLISGYEDRLVHTNNTYFTGLRNTIYKKYHPNGNATGVPTFRNFVDFLLEQVSQQIEWDIHWRPINDLCTPCYARFDAILKIETYQRDFNLLLRNANLEGVLQPVQLNHVRKDHPDALVRKYLAEITQDQLLRLYSAYRYDFEMFGYPIEKYLAYPKAPI